MMDSQISTTPRVPAAAQDQNQNEQQRQEQVNDNNNATTSTMMIQSLEEQVAIEKAGKRKLFHSLVKMAEELRCMQKSVKPLLYYQQQYLALNWYDGVQRMSYPT